MATKTTTTKRATKAAPTRTVARGTGRTVADYIAAAPKDKRAALMELRKTIKAAAPKATERISYGIVGFKHNGESLVHFGYWKDHFALYGNFDVHAVALKGYDQSGKGTIRFPADKPLPYRLVAKVVKARVAEIEKAG